MKTKTILFGLMLLCSLFIVSSTNDSNISSFSTGGGKDIVMLKTEGRENVTELCITDKNMTYLICIHNQWLMDNVAMQHNLIDQPNPSINSGKPYNESLFNDFMEDNACENTICVGTTTTTTTTKETTTTLPPTTTTSTTTTSTKATTTTTQDGGLNGT